MELGDAFWVWVRIGGADVKGSVSLLVLLMCNLELSSWIAVCVRSFDRLKRGADVTQRLNRCALSVQGSVSLLACERVCDMSGELIGELCFEFWYSGDWSPVGATAMRQLLLRSVVR